MPMIGRRFYPGMKRGAMGFMQSGDFPVPVGHWKFGKNAGAVAYDSGSGGNNGTIYGASWVKGFLGPGLSFDNVDDYVDMGDDSSLEPAGEASWGLRFKSVSRNLYDRLMQKGSLGSVVGYGLAFDNDDRLTAWYHTGISENVIRSSIEMEDDVEYRVFGVWNGTIVKIYINGVDVSQAGASGYWTYQTADLNIGRRAGEKATLFHGIADEAQLYDVGLTARQILELEYGIR